MSDISDDEVVEEKSLERKHLRNILKRSFRVAYFLGILFSMKNRVKIYGALRPIDQVKEFDSSNNAPKRKSYLVNFYIEEKFIEFNYVAIFTHRYNNSHLDYFLDDSHDNDCDIDTVYCELCG